MLDEVRLYSDGAARRNPGPAAAGFRILSPAGELLFEHEESLGERTNNQAEYAALILGLEACRTYTSGKVTVGSDSKLLVQQMKGLWRVRDAELHRLQVEAEAKAARLTSVQYEHHPARSRRSPVSIGRSIGFWTWRRWRAPTGSATLIAPAEGVTSYQRRAPSS
jgi:ribonuclease HI